MPKTNTLDSEAFPKEFTELHNQLHCFLRYFATPVGPASGRKAYASHGIIYWPDFITAVQRSTGWFERFYPPKGAELRRQQRGVPRSGPVWRTWRMRDLQREVERFLRPLLIPTDSTVGGDYTTYALDRRGFGEDKIDDVIPEAWAALNDAKNYTFFRRISHAMTPLTRAMLLPPDLLSFKRSQAALPQEIVAVYYAWQLIAERHRYPYDPAVAGVEWAKNGMLFVNWKRFLESSHKPPTDITPYDCAQFLRGGHTKGKYRLKLTAFPDPRKYEDLPQSTRVIDFDDFAMMSEPCSLIDVAYLEERPELFDATYHVSRARAKEKTKQKSYARLKRQREERQLNPDTPKHRSKLAKLITFPFRPFEHVPHQFATYEKPLWFDQTYDETLYAISYNKKLYFAAPSLMSKTLVDKAPSETSAWFYAMDCLSCVEQFTESGHVGDTLEKTRSTQITALKEKEYERTAAEIIKNFISLDELSAREMRRVRQRTASRMGSDTSTAYDGSRWYQELVLSTARDHLTATSVRRRAFAQIPGRYGDEPKMVPFYSPLALKQFQNAAKGMLTIREDMAVMPPTEAAPYVYAWATFCLQAGEHADLHTVKEPTANGHWTPQEDVVLIEDYTTHPRMGVGEKMKLLNKLPRHNWKGLVRRVNILNKMLDPLLNIPRQHRYTIGKLWLLGTDPREDEHAAAVRLVILIGIAHTLKYRGERPNRILPVVSDAMKLTPKTLASMSRLPDDYRSDQFELLARG